MKKNENYITKEQRQIEIEDANRRKCKKIMQENGNEQRKK